MNRYAIWKKIGLGAAMLAAIAGPTAFHVVNAAPEPARKLPQTQAVAVKSFLPVCKATEVVDSRPDPAWVGASFAHDNCWAPRPPTPPDGYTASSQQIDAGMAAVKKYHAAADAYQQCIADFVAARKTAAGKDKKPIDAALIMIESHRITASQESKKRVSRQIEVAINAFNEYGSECPE